MAASSPRGFIKIFVANLPWTVGHFELRNYFNQFGRVFSANVVFDKKTGCSKGYGFVAIEQKESVDNFEKHILEGNTLIIQKQH